MLNSFALQGRLTHDPELRQTQSGIAVCSFRVAWSEKYKDTETKLFINCTAWRGMGEMVSKYFHKGQEILLRGKLSTRTWVDNDGNNRSNIEMTVQEVSFCGPKQDGYSSASYPAGAPVDVVPSFEELDDDDGELPF